MGSAGSLLTDTLPRVLLARVSAPQFSSRIGNAYLPSHLKAEGVRRKTAASASFRRARYVYVRGATAYDDRDAPSFKPVDLAQANFNTVESKMFRDTMLASFVQAVLKSVCALLKCTLVKSSSVFFSRTGCLTRYKTSSLFLAQCTTAATFATAFAGIEWESRFHVRILVLADCPNHEIFYCILQRRQMGLAGHV